MTAGTLDYSRPFCQVEGFYKGLLLIQPRQAFVDDRQGLTIADQTAGRVDGKADVDAWLKARAERHREVKDRRRVVRSRTILPHRITCCRNSLHSRTRQFSAT